MEEKETHEKLNKFEAREGIIYANILSIKNLKENPARECQKRRKPTVELPGKLRFEIDWKT